MSRQNKVNPGMYTQRGRLSQDDAARELRKQSVFASPHTWQPVNTKTTPRLAPAGDARDSERSADNETMAETPPRVERRAASRVTRNKTTTRAPSPKAKAKTAKAKTASTRKAKSTTGKVKNTTGKVKNTAGKAKRASGTATKKRATVSRARRR